MELPIKTVVLVGVVGMLCGAYIEKQFDGSAKLSDETTINKDIITIIKKKKNKDGSTETDTKIVDKSKEKEKVVQVAPAKAPDWFISAGIGLSKDMSKVYVGSVNRRILGPVYIGVWGTTQQSAGASIALQF